MSFAPHSTRRVTSSKTRAGFGWWAMRAFWGGLAASHVWPVGTLLLRLIASPNVGDAASLGILALVLPVFLLKALDRRVVRTGRPLLELLVFLLCTGLVHGNTSVAEMAVGAPPEALVVSVALVSAASPRVRHHVRSWVLNLVARLRDPAAPPLCGAASPQPSVPFGRWALDGAPRCLFPRPPPSV